jgi:hypothetical protein
MNANVLSVGSERPAIVKLDITNDGFRVSAFIDDSVDGVEQWEFVNHLAGGQKLVHLSSGKGALQLLTVKKLLLQDINGLARGDKGFSNLTVAAARASSDKIRRHAGRGADTPTSADLSRRHRCHGDGISFWPIVCPALRV